MKAGASSSGSVDGDARGRIPLAVPDYKLLRLIGEGSYGEVWLARTVTGLYHAVKVVYQDHFSEEHPYEREFKGLCQFLAASRVHASLLGIYHVGECPGCFYYVMELADDAGEGSGAQAGQLNPETYIPKTLRSLQRQPADLVRTRSSDLLHLSVAQCVEIGLALASALDYLHRQGLVHRDIKPSNIIFVKGQAKLADIGLVTAAGEQSRLGTEGYMAPEGPGSPQADVYSLGKVLYEMMTGLDRRETSGTDWAAGKRYPSLPTWWAEAQDLTELNELREVVLRACQPKRQWRYETAGQMRSDLDKLRSGKSGVLKLRREKRVLQLMLAGISAVVFLGTLALGFFVLKNRAAEEHRHRELREIQISGMEPREDGWFSNEWSRVMLAGAIRKDDEVLERATALLAGLDARPLALLRGVRAASAAFAPDGRAMISGLGTDATILMNPDGTKSEMPARGAGPVCWGLDGEPMQLTAATNGLILREVITGKVRREFALAGANPSVPEADPGLDSTPDGTAIAAVLHNRLLVWKGATGEKLGEAEVEASALALSPDGSLVGVGSEDGTIRVYAAPGLVKVAELPPALRGSPILCLAFARDRVVRYGLERRTNSWLLAAGDKGAGIVVWDLDRRLPRSFCRGSSWNVAAIAFSPDGLTLASAGRNYAHLWDIMSGQLLLGLSQVSTGESLALAFDATGRRLICGGEPGAGQATTAIWELEPQRGIQAFRGLASSVRKAWLSANAQRVAALSDDWHLGIWERASGQLLFLIETPVGVLADNAAGSFTASGEQFGFASGREACVYNLQTGGVARRWRLNMGLSDQMQFDGRGRLLLLRRERGSEPRSSIWRLYELGGGQSPILLHKQTETNWLAEELALAPGGERFIVWNGGPKGIQRVIRGYDVASGKELWKTATARTEGNSRVYLDPTGQWFAYNPDPDPHPEQALRRLPIVRFSDFQEIGTAPKDCRVISPSKREFAGPGGLYVEGTESQRRFPLTMAGGFDGDTMAFSRDGNLLAWGTTAGVVFVADIQEVLRRLSKLRK